MNTNRTRACRTALVTAAVVLVTSTLRADPLNCDLSGYRPSPGLIAAVADNRLTLTWDGDRGQQVRLRFAIAGGTPTIEELAVSRQGGGWSTVTSQVTPEFHVVSGLRRITQQQLRPDTLRAFGIEVTPEIEHAWENRDRTTPGVVEQEGSAERTWVQLAIDGGGLTREILDEEKWDAFWDAPLNVPGDQVAHGGSTPPAEGLYIDGVLYQPGLPRSPDEITRGPATYRAQSCTVTTSGARLEVVFPGVEAGVFAGRLEYTVYRGTNLIRQEIVATTERQSVAYKYDAGLKGLSIAPGSRVVWRDITNLEQVSRLGGAKNEAPVPLQASNRLVAVESSGGSIAAFPPPHKFFWAREVEFNLGYNWYRKDSDSTFSFGVRQAEAEAPPHVSGRGPEDYSQNFALYSARPGTWQRMGVFLYVSAGPAEDALEAALAFTRGDRYKALPGYQVMATHFHTSPVRRMRALGGLDVRLPDFDVMKAAGVNIFAPIGPGVPRTLENLADYYEAARRHSDRDFLIMPNYEGGAAGLGGHIDLLLSKPVFWTENRKEGEPFMEEHPTYGTVYRLGGPEDMMAMAERENILIYMPHPRSKGSTGFPDAVKDTDHFRHERYRGIGYRWGMGIDGSETRLCEYRCLALLDEMNNWVADLPTPPKYLQAITETYEKGPGDDIYANNPVNYVRIDRVPAVDDMSSIVDAMRRGDYFVTSGEVLIPYYQVSGTGRQQTITAEVEWTFPLEFAEVVWGDGRTTDRQIVHATDLPPFGRHRFEIPFDATGKKWVRFAVWDTAGNGALVQPVKLQNAAAPGR
jgi:hypothetical protein